MTAFPVPDGAVVEAAPAKLNLYLHVTGRRADGFHLLDSLIAFADLHDTVVAAPADDLTLTVAGPFAAALEVGSDNLVLQAARALAGIVMPGRGAALTLIKRLPVASGIGGGSADAAATLRALTALWRAVPAVATLDRLAADLGADVPMCLHGRAAFAGGVGETLEPAPALPAVGLVLANPLRPVATPDIFRRRTGPFSGTGRFETPPPTLAAFCAVLTDRRNDLEAPALAVEPLIGRVIEALAASEGCGLARMSGSGATCFGIYADIETAKAAAAAIASRRPGWWVRSSPLITDTRILEPSLTL